MKHSSLIVAATLIASQLGCADNPSPTDPSSNTATLSVLTPTTVSLVVGGTTQILVALVSTDDTQTLVLASGTWTSSNPTVATVAAAGLVTARAPGTADIKVTVAEGTAIVTVTVTASTAPPPLTFVGVAAGPSSDTGTLKFSVSAPPQVTGSVYFRRRAVGVSLIGRFDEQTRVVDVAGGGFRFLGVVSGNVLTGAYVDSLGLTGGFSAIDATHTTVTAFCGSYTSDATTPLGNSDAGSIVLAVSSDGTTTASVLTADASHAPQTFTGRLEGEELSLVSRIGATLQGRLQGESATGVFPTNAGSPASFSTASNACQ